MSGYNDNIGDIDEPDDAWSNLPESFGLDLERRRQAQAFLAQQSDNPKDSQSESEGSESSESIDESKLANMLAR